MHGTSASSKRILTLPLAGAALIIGLTLGPSLVAADTVPQGATVAISDSGFTPPAVTVAAGATVTWKNQGTIVHTASSVPGINPSFDTGGVAAGQAASITFTVPGSYYYTSATECLHNTSNGSGPFACSGSYLVTVVPAGTSIAQAVPAAPAVQPAAPAAAPAQQGSAGSATVTITDQGVSPAQVNILLNGNVTWLNKGSNVHTATSTSDSNGSNPSFDTGGIGAGQTALVGFSRPGTYTYTSAIDCLSGGKPTFNCGPFTIVVSSTPVTQPTPAGGVATPTPNPTVQALGNTVITIDETKGFQPNPLNVKVGQTVSWLNLGQQTHSVVLNQGDPQTVWWMPLATSVIPLDSGGIGPSQSYSFTFQTVGTFPYHDSTTPLYNHDNSCSCNVTAFMNNGVVNVSQ